jgi:ribonuclease R
LHDSGDVEAAILHPLEEPASRIVGVFKRRRDGAVILSADRRDRAEYRLPPAECTGLADGDLIVAAELPARRFAPKRAKVIERLGPSDGPGAISRLTIAAYDIPTEFPPAALAEAAAAGPVDAHARADLRDFGLVTIDGSDARDFDDAVWAEPDDDPANQGGWHLIVAIADVAWYVTPGSALDREAERRGNSVYFPDQVVPMLPEALSNGLCSLKPDENRACLAAHLWIDTEGRKRRHRFERAIMRSAARLTYEQAQAAHDDWTAAPLTIPRERLDTLYGAYAALERWRTVRGALALDLTEYRVILDSARQPMAIVPHTRLDSHRLIEEFMILANVAAAEELEARHLPCMYRVHDEPDPEKLAALRDFLDEAGVPGLALTKGQVIRPELFNRLLQRAAGTPVATVINEVVLRAQAQAVYSPNNIGHFGLALPRYAHFTSPIRRYADLLVHRALIAGLSRERKRLADLPGDLATIGEHISGTERRAAAAEREALDRYRAKLLGNAVGTIFQGRITGVAPFGLFVTIAESGSDGLIPVSTLPSDFYDHDPRRHRLVGRRWSRVFALGDAIIVCLNEVDPIAGRLAFRLHEEADTSPRSGGFRREHNWRRIRRTRSNR